MCAYRSRPQEEGKRVASKTESVKGGRLCGKKLALAIGAALLAGAFSVMPKAEALPVAEPNASSTAHIATPDATTMNITSEATNNLIKWVDFSIAGGDNRETVNFDSNNYLNYVTGSARSDILGTLTGDGNIYLVNPNGILIGDGATVNVGNLYLSTKPLDVAALTSYDTAITKLSSVVAATGDVVNLGTLKAASISVEGNNITIKNIADVQDATGSAQNTQVTLAAGSGGEIHLGYAVGAEAENVNDTQYTNETLSNPTGWTFKDFNGNGKEPIKYMLVRNAYELQNMQNNRHEATTIQIGGSLTQAVPAYIDGNYMLAGNIDASGITFTPVGNGKILDGMLDIIHSELFQGRFDGLNYKVSNLHLSVSGDYNKSAGLFGLIGDKGVVENLEVARTTTVAYNGSYHLHNLGAVAGINAGTLRNVRNTGAITYNNEVDCFGGVVGVNVGTIDRAYNTGALTGEIVQNLGGIAGQNGTSKEDTNLVGGVPVVTYSLGCSGVITNAFNTGDLSGTYNKDLLSQGVLLEVYTKVGGIAGSMHYSDSSIENAYNSGNLTTPNRTNHLGGIAGRMFDGVIKCTYNSGELVSSNGEQTDVHYVNGIACVSDNRIVGNWANNYSTQFYKASYVSKLTEENRKKQATYKNFDFSENGVWRIYEGQTMPLLTAFMTRKDSDKGTADYDGRADVGFRYVAPTESGAGVTQLGANAVNYVKDYLTFTERPLTVTAGSIDKTYDGTAMATLTVDMLSNVVEGDADKLTVSTATATYDNKNVGTNKTVTYTGLTLGGEKAKNYSIAVSGTGTGDISKALLKISVEDMTKTYDGTTGTANATGGKLIATSGTTLIDGDSLSGGTITFTDKNAGTGNKTVTVYGVTVNDGNNGGNYQVSYAHNTTSTINKAPITVSVGNVTKTYDGTTGTANATIGELIVTSGTLSNGDRMIGGTFAFADKNAGTGNKTVKVSGVVIKDIFGNADNYDISYADNTTSTINKAPITFTVADGFSREYDGTMGAQGAKIAVVSGKMFAGDSYSGGNFGFNDRDVGTNKTLTVQGAVIDDGNSGKNYDVTYRAGRGTITRKTLYLAADPVTVAESDPKPTVTGNVTGFVRGEGLTSKDKLVFVALMPRLNGNKPGTYAVTGTLNGKRSGDYGKNYTFDNAPENARAYTVTAKAQTELADRLGGTEAAQEYTNTVSSLQSGADLLGGTEAAQEYTNTVSSLQRGAASLPTTVTSTLESAPTTNGGTQGNSNDNTQEKNESTGTPQTQTTGGLPPATSERLTIEGDGVNVSGAMDTEALAAALSGGKTTEQANALGTNAAPNAPAEPTAEQTGAPGENGEEETR